MGSFEEKYTEDQRDALAHAYEDRRIRPADRVAALAAAGELQYNGDFLEPFETNAATVRYLAQRLRKRRAGEIKSDLASLPPADAIEALRRRYINGADAMLTAWEKRARKQPGAADPKRLQEIGRCIREAAAIPGPGDRRPVKPGQRDPETGLHNGDRTTSGLAAQIAAAAKRSQTAHEADPPESRTEGIAQTQSAEHAAAVAHYQQHGWPQQGTQPTQPGGRAPEQVEAHPSNQLQGHTVA